MHGRQMGGNMTAEAEGEDLGPEQLDAEPGYMIGIKVHGDGSLSVCRKPLPMEDERPGKSDVYEEMSVDSIEQALKAALKFYKANPVGQDQEAQFAAGFRGLNQSPATEGHGLMQRGY